jgi:hypothetical protein
MSPINAHKLDLADRYGSPKPIKKGSGSIKKTMKFALAVFVLLLFCLILAGALEYNNIKNAYKEAQAGKWALEDSARVFASKDMERAAKSAIDAGSHFENAKSSMEAIRSGLIVKIIPRAGSEVENLANIIESARLVAGAAEKGITTATGLKAKFKDDRPFSKLNPTEKREVLAHIYSSDSALASIADNLADAERLASGDSMLTLFNPLKERLAAYREALAQALALTERAVPASKLIPELAGFPKKKRLLFLLQNSDELRPTGGFIGTYGIVETDGGEIRKFETHDVYHLDMPLDKTLKITPPPPIAEYLNKNWFFRDSNWAPDFPTTAEKALWFFGEENKALKKPPEEAVFDGVIAVTPEFMSDLIALTGSVTIEGTEYTADNFSRLLEYRVEKDYIRLGEPSWQRKEVIGEIGKVIKERVFDLPLKDWAGAFRIFESNVAEKSVLAYFGDSAVEKFAFAEKAGGEISKSESGDFFMAVDFNMGALKTDAVMEKGLSYKVVEKEDGLYAIARLSYMHPGGSDWRTSEYKAYVRLFVPAGSELISSKGASKGEVYAGNEFGKAFFGAYISVAPGSSGVLSYEYKLPERITEEIAGGKYKLIIQKQPGSKIKEAQFDSNFSNKIKSKDFPQGEGDSTDAKRAVWRGDLAGDKDFIINF